MSIDCEPDYKTFPIKELKYFKKHSNVWNIRNHGCLAASPELCLSGFKEF